MDMTAELNEITNFIGIPPLVNESDDSNVSGATIWKNWRIIYISYAPFLGDMELLSSKTNSKESVSNPPFLLDVGPLELMREK
ncbi:hypothetical protein C5167_038458 [Papaver somniferum]|uniref:Uncharacterized protein n=1 Tax=Papaver somniferum TaxID=3469 RepID=A0A4Y7ICZ2_PAPSO|nr:hypothetical protein C5167_038458 [Papaver somniferum]